MILRTLTLSGFTSYRKPVTLDFTRFNIACISGSNGAGKSSILDAITYALYGKARKSDEALINSASDKAEVRLDFEYEGQIYRVIRALTRGKGSSLDFFILNPLAGDEEHRWKGLTEHTIRETDAKIERTLRLDYETFINASFFLQGKADSFATQGPADRKKILSSILGLNRWNEYLEACRTRIKETRIELEIIDARLIEIQKELDQESERKARLENLEDKLKVACAELKILQARLETERAKREKLDEKRQVVALLRKNLDRATSNHENTLRRYEERQAQLTSFNQLLANASQTEKEYLAWQQARKELETFDQLYEQFKPIDGKRQDLIKELDLKRQSLKQDLQHLKDERARLEATQTQHRSSQSQLELISQRVQKLQQDLAKSETLQDDMNQLISLKSTLESENKNLVQKMNELKERQTTISAAEGAQCPLCDQPLSTEHRQNLIDKIQEEGEALSKKYYENKTQFEEANKSLKAGTDALRARNENQQLLQNLLREKDRLAQILAQDEQLQHEFDTERAPKIAALESALQDESFLPETRAKIQAQEAELAKLGYDAAAHATVRQTETQARNAEKAFHELGKARSSVEQIKLTLSELELERKNSEKELEAQNNTFAEAAANFAAEEAALPDLRGLEREQLNQKETEAALQREIGSVKQQLYSINQQRERQLKSRQEQETLNQHLRRLRSLETAFGKDGVPAMLIEQALPELEAQANEILLKLSDHRMSVTFSTQREYKNKKRDDKRETLDILISDGSTTRDYETFSGGEAFRVNFAIRLALSRVLSKRAGARMQTLIIDEGFGNQDSHGRQLLIEAINMIQDDFEKILVITHIEELKEQFNNRIEVSKDETGSSVIALSLG